MKTSLSATLSLLLLAVAGTAPGLAWAQDRADLDRSQIIGNRELPKVLYIVPWKKPLPGGLAGRPVQSVLDEVLAPLDRDVFRRQLQYQAQRQSARATPANGPPAPGTAATTPTPPISQEKVQ